MMMRYALTGSLVLGLILTTGGLHAAIYEQHDPDGNLTYSDTPSSDTAKRVDMPDNSLSQFSSPPEAMMKPLPHAPVQAAAYTTFQILSPKDQETIQNQPVIPVEIKLEPELRTGDSIQMLVDGIPVGAPATETHIILKNVERGTHQLGAVILDGNKTTIQESNSITIYVHRITPESPARQGTNRLIYPVPLSHLQENG